MVRYLTAGELVIGKRYRIDMPSNWGPRHLETRYGNFTERRGNMLYFHGEHGGVRFATNYMSTAPITNNPDDTGVRVSLSGHDVMVSKALGRVSSDTERYIRKFGGKSRKTRRRGKKTLRRK
jgi:hypothetical protein